jgi:hypothetical protein
MFGLFKKPDAATISKRLDDEMWKLIGELRVHDASARGPTGDSIFDLYMLLTAPFALDTLKNIPGLRNERADVLLDLQGKLRKQDNYAWAICRLFNQWFAAAMLDKPNEAQLAEQLAYFMRSGTFPPE